LPGAEAKEPLAVEYARSFFPVILIVLLVRSFLAEPFRIPSSSMMPTLLVGDFILVNKFAYGLRLPVLDTKFIPLGEPERGDVVVFRYPRLLLRRARGTQRCALRRAVRAGAAPGLHQARGRLPGDEVVYRNKTLYLNGKLVQSDRSGATSAPAAAAT
jgi:signal peptidase I